MKMLAFSREENEELWHIFNPTS